MHTERCTIRDGLEGDLRYNKPTGALVVLCHGYQSSSNHPAVAGIARGLSTKGYATFTFNFSGKNPLDLVQQTTDIGDIVTHFTDDYPEITLLAGSFGALSAAIAARRQKELAGLITINGFFGSAQLGRRYMPTFLAFKALTLASACHRKIWAFYNREYQPEQITVPTLVMHSAADTIVSAIQSKDFYKQLGGPKQFVDLNPADHHLSSDMYTTQVVDEIDDWITRY